MILLELWKEAILRGIFLKLGLPAGQAKQVAKTPCAFSYIRCRGKDLHELWSKFPKQGYNKVNTGEYYRAEEERC